MIQIKVSCNSYPSTSATIYSSSPIKTPTVPLHRLTSCSKALNFAATLIRLGSPLLSTLTFSRTTTSLLPLHANLSPTSSCCAGPPLPAPPSGPWPSANPNNRSRKLKPDNEKSPPSPPPPPALLLGVPVPEEPAERPSGSTGLTVRTVKTSAESKMLKCSDRF